MTLLIDYLSSSKPQSLLDKGKGFWVTILLSILITAVPCNASDIDILETSVTKIQTQLKHADTYYWFGMAEKGNMHSFRQGLYHIDRAEELARNHDIPEAERAHLFQETKGIRTDIKEQMSMHYDTFYGFFPLVRLLAPSLFSNALSTGTFELVDDTDVIATTNAGRNLSQDVFQKWSSRPQLNVIFTSIPQNDLLENEVLYIFNATSKFFVHNYREVVAALTPKQLEQFNSRNITSDIVNSLCNSFGISNILIVTVREMDKIGKDYFSLIEGHIYNLDSTKPSHTFFHMGFSRDRNAFFWPVLWTQLLLYLLAIILFSFINWLKGRKVTETLPLFLIPSIGFLVGRITPWALNPVISSMAPPAENLAILSWWWPCLAGVVLFLGPPVIYRIGAGRMKPIASIFDMDGQGGAIFTAIALGVCAYLSVPLYLLLEGNALQIIIILTISTCYALYALGCSLDTKEGTPLTCSLLIVLSFLILGAALCHLAPEYIYIACGLTIAFSTCALGQPLQAIINKLKKSREIKQVSNTNEKQGTKTNVLPPVPINTEALIQRIQNPPFLELEFFEECYKQVHPLNQGETITMSLISPSGSGKTATAEAIIRKLKQENANIEVLAGKCPPENPDGSKEIVPYAPFRKALASYFGINILSPPENQLQHIDDMLGGIFESVVPFSGLFFPATKSSQKTASNKKEIFIAIADTIRKLASSKTVILFIDDIQWIDDSSRDLLTFLLQEFPEASENNIPLLILLTSRENIKTQGLETSETLFLADLIKDGEFEKILVDRLRLSPPIAKKIISDSGFKISERGGLFWLLQMVSYLAENAFFSRTDEGYIWAEKFSRHAKLPVPDNYREAILQQIKKVPEYRDYLACAACIGSEFYASTLADCFETTRLKTINILQMIEEMTGGLIYDVRGNDDLYYFHSSIVLEIIRDVFNISLQGPKGNNAPQVIFEYHSKIADSLTKNLAKSSSNIWQIASHYYAAGNTHADQAIEYCLEAARMARFEFNFSETEKFITMAEEHASLHNQMEKVEEEKLFLECDKAHVGVKGVDTHETALLALHYYDCKSPLSFSALTAIARACYDGYHPEIAAKAFEVSLGIIDVAENDIEEAEGCHFLGINSPKKNVKEVKEKLRHSYRLLEPFLINFKQTGTKNIEALSLLARVANSLAEVLSYGIPEEKKEAKEKYNVSLLLKELKEISDKLGLGMTHGGLGRLARTFEKDIKSARYHFTKDLEYSRETGDTRGQSMMYSSLGECDLFEAEEVRKRKNADMERSLLESALTNYQNAEKIAGPNLVNKFFALTGLLSSYCLLGAKTESDRVGLRLLKVTQTISEVKKDFLEKDGAAVVLTVIKKCEDCQGTWTDQLKQLAEQTLNK